MTRHRIAAALAVLLALAAAPARGQDAAPAPAPAAEGPSFMKEVAPLFVQSCTACHNARKAEGKYVMTSFAALVKGGTLGEAVAPGAPDESPLVELIQHDAEPRMPYKLDPLTPEQVDLVTRWVAAGARYDGTDPAEDWPALLHKMTVVAVPEAYPIAVPITAVAFSPDGTRLMTGGFHEVNLWNVADGALAGRVRGLSERVYDIAVSPDGKLVATASGDPGRFGRAQLWSVGADGALAPVRDLCETSDVVYAVAFSPDGATVASAGADRAIRLHEVASGSLAATIEDHADWIFDLAFSPDGARLASASRDKTSKVFDVAKRESLVTFPGHGEAVYAVGWTADGKSVVSGGGDAQLRWWNPDEEGKQVRNVGVGGPAFALRFTPDRARFVVTSSDRQVRVVKADDGAVEKTLGGHADWVYSVAVSPDGKLAATGAWDGSVIVWDLAEGKAVRTIVAAPGLSGAEVIRPFPPGSSDGVME